MYTQIQNRMFLLPQLGISANIFRFSPRRWLQNGDGTRLSRGTDNFMPFGAGTRSCGGIYLARMELRVATASFFRQFPGATLSSTATAASMEVVDRFNTHPVGRKCEIVLAK
jgi:cytochrome P450